MKLLLVFLCFLCACSSKTPPPVISSQKRLPNLALWNDVDKNELTMAVSNFFLKKKRREKLKPFPEMLPNTRVALFRAQDPEFFYPDRRMGAFFKRCKQMISASCYKLGKDFLKRRKFSDAFSFLEKGCNLNEGESCFLAGVLEFNNKKYNSSEYFFRKGCNLGSNNSCYNLIEHFFEKASDISENPLKTHDLLCQKGLQVSCAKFSYLRFDKGMNDAEKKESLNILEVACQAGEGSACYYLAFLYDHEEDEENAQVYLRRSCLKNSAAGCFELARMGYGISDHRKIILKKSLELGFNQWEILELEPRLEFLRQDKNVKEMIEVFVLKGPR